MEIDAIYHDFSLNRRRVAGYLTEIKMVLIQPDYREFLKDEVSSPFF